MLIAHSDLESNCFCDLEGKKKLCIIIFAQLYYLVPLGIENVEILGNSGCQSERNLVEVEISLSCLSGEI